MFKGFMDHWVPTAQGYSEFWKQDFETAARILDELREDVDFDHFTFYTKWYTNGIRSRLPYLYNHPEASNVKTDNEWGRKLIDHLRAKGISVGSMIQFLTYEQQCWEPDLTIDEWDVRNCAETEQPIQIADFTDPRFQVRVKEIVKEQLEQFPALDYLFMEFEGVKAEALEALYERLVRERNPAVGESGEAAQSLRYTAAALEHCARIGVTPSFLWSEEAAGMLRHYYSLNLQAVRDAVTEVGYRGAVGVVIYSYGYETLIYPDVIPDPDWWLLPWCYWVWEKSSPAVDGRMAVSKELMARWKQEGRKVCYIGDVTIAFDESDPEFKEAAIRDFYAFSQEVKLDGYLGMGNPVPEMGLKWLITDECVSDMRKLYRELYGAGRSLS